MVHFRDNGYTIDINTGANPVEDWIELQKEILTLICVMDNGSYHLPWRATQFLIELLPDWEDAKRMVK